MREDRRLWTLTSREPALIRLEQMVDEYSARQLKHLGVAKREGRYYQDRRPDRQSSSAQLCGAIVRKSQITHLRRNDFPLLKLAAMMGRSVNLGSRDRRHQLHRQHDDAVCHHVPLDTRSMTIQPLRLSSHNPCHAAKSRALGNHMLTIHRMRF